MTNPAPADLTRATRLVDAERNKRLVMAESALAGERVMAIFRLVLVALLALSQIVVEASKSEDPEGTPWRLVAVAIYVAFWLATVRVLGRATPRPDRAFAFPFLASLVDFGFLTAMDACDVFDHGRLDAAMTVVARAMILIISVTRFATIQVWWAVALAIASYAATFAWRASVEAREVTFVIASFLVMGLVIAWTSRRLNTMFGDIRRRDNLTRFLPRAVAERVLELGEASLAPVQREVTVMFADIRDFTTLSEQLSPRVLLQLLDEHLGEMAQVVKDHDGMVNKFLGDGMLALWGVPDATKDHAERAIGAALAMRAKLAELNAQRVQLGEAPIHMGIGLHSGPVAAGMLGGAEQHEYTVIGDAVNVASRIEGLTKRLAVDILVSDRTRQLAQSAARFDERGVEQVKGRAEAVTVYGVRPTK